MKATEHKNGRWTLELTETEMKALVMMVRLEIGSAAFDESEQMGVVDSTICRAANRIYDKLEQVY